MYRCGFYCDSNPTIIGPDYHNNGFARLQPPEENTYYYGCARVASGGELKFGYWISKRQPQTGNGAEKGIVS